MSTEDELRELREEVYELKEALSVCFSMLSCDSDLPEFSRKILNECELKI